MKTRWLVVVAATLLSFPGAPGAAQETTSEEVVAEFFPQRLIDESEDDHARGGPLPFRASDFVESELGGEGVSFLVAAYTNGFSGAVRVLRKVGTQWQLVDEPRLPRLGGVFPSVSLVDLESDGLPEVLVSLSSGRGPTADWVFAWEESHLVPVNPVVADDAGEIDTVLSDADLLDLNGDGRLEMINPTGSGPVAPDETEPIGVGDFDVYSFDGESFVLTGTATFFGTVERGTGPPEAERFLFQVPSPDGPFRMALVNGTEDGTDRVSSAVVRLNGQQIAGPRRFNQNVERLELEVSLREENVLSIELRGSPGGRVTFSFEPAI